MSDISINQINNFLSDKEKCAKVMIGTKIFKTFSTAKDNKVKHNEFIQAQKSYESSNNIPYFHCRIFSIENVELVLNLLDKVDSSFIFLHKKKIHGKYSVIEVEIFLSYLNPEFKDIIRYLSLIEYIDGKENNDKLKILFEVLEKYYHYCSMQYLNTANAEC